MVWVESRSTLICALRDGSILNYSLEMREMPRDSSVNAVFTPQAVRSLGTIPSYFVPFADHRESFLVLSDRPWKMHWKPDAVAGPKFDAVASNHVWRVELIILILSRFFLFFLTISRLSNSTLPHSLQIHFAVSFPTVESPRRSFVIIHENEMEIVTIEDATYSIRSTSLPHVFAFFCQRFRLLSASCTIPSLELLLLPQRKYSNPQFRRASKLDRICWYWIRKSDFLYFLFAQSLA